METKLKPCPGCGGVALANERDERPRPINCTQCGFAAFDAEDWNRRTPGPATARLLTAAKWFREIATMYGHGPEKVGSDYSRIWKNFSADIDAADAEHEPAKPAKAE